MVAKDPEPLLELGLISAPLVTTRHTMPLRGLGPDHTAAELHPARRGLLDQLRRGHPVGYWQNLIRVAPRAPLRILHLVRNDNAQSPYARVRERPQPQREHPELGARCPTHHTAPSARAVLVEDLIGRKQGPKPPDALPNGHTSLRIR